MKAQIIILLVFAIHLTSCDIFQMEEDEPMSIDMDLDGIPDTQDVCPSLAEIFNNVFDRDGCPDTPLDLYNAVRSDVEAAWNVTFQTNGIFYTPIQRFIVFSPIPQSISACGTNANSSGPFYCPVDLGVYLEDRFMLDQLNRIGDMAPAVVIAHEVGHHVQNLLGILQGGFFSIQIELQADCFAGAWARSAGARGLLEVGDLQEAAQTMFEIGDPAGIPWFAPGAHGTSQQRQNAFGTGFSFGSDGCFSSDFAAELES